MLEDADVTDVVHALQECPGRPVEARNPEVVICSGLHDIKDSINLLIVTNCSQEEPMKIRDQMSARGRSRSAETTASVFGLAVRSNLG